MARPSTQLILTPVLPKGKSVAFGMVGNGSFGPASNGSSGGWQIIDRPRQKALTQWMDSSPMQLDLTLIIDGAGGSIEPQCSLVFEWQYPKHGQQQPPVLAITGPVDAKARSLYWVIYTVKFDLDKVIRNPSSGARTQQNLTLSLYEYVPATASVLTHLSPARIAHSTLAAQGVGITRRSYTVKSGDTLATIAARVLGDFSLWPQLAAINKIRDPRSATELAVGRKLLLPS